MCLSLNDSFTTQFGLVACVLVQLLGACQKGQNSQKDNPAPSSAALAKKPRPGAALADTLQPVNAAWRSPSEVVLNASAVCVRATSGGVSCADLTDAEGPHFRSLNLLGEVDTLIADQHNLCAVRGSEIYCLSDALWLPTNARAKEFGVFRRAFALDGTDHLGSINTDPARFTKDGPFTVRSLRGGGDYVVDNVQSWTKAQVSMRQEACGLTQSGQVVCYKAKEVNVEPREGGPAQNRISLANLTPVALPRPARSIAVSESYSCALLDDGQVYCWLPPRVGGNEQRLAGARIVLPFPQATSEYDSTAVEPAPRLAVKMELSTTARELVSGRNFVCAVGVDQAVYCWGGNNWGQLGQVRPIAGSRIPVRVQNLGPVTHLAAADVSVCALDVAGGVYCWGKLVNNLYQRVAEQFSRVPRRITDSGLERPNLDESICPAAMQVTVQPDVWARQLKQTRDPVEQARLLDELLMEPAKPGDSISTELPKLERVILEHSPSGPNRPLTWLVRTDWSIGKNELSTRSQVLIPISQGTYCAVAPSEIAAIDRDAVQRPCRSHPTLGKFDGPYRAHFITLTNNTHWALEVYSATGRVDPLTDDEFHYEVTYYDLVGFTAQRVFNMELFGGTCGKTEDAPTVDITRTFKLTPELPRTFLVQQCQPGHRCVEYKAVYSNSEYQIEEPEQPSSE
jgi:hypothetical protein